ncbi:MAG: LexA family transcriptional regulator [Bacteroidota bacterium]
MKSTRKFVDPNKILDRLRDVYALGSDAELARFLEVNPSTVATWRAKQTMKYDRIFERAEDLNLHWLLTGEGTLLPETGGKGITDRHPVHPPSATSSIPYLEPGQIETFADDKTSASTQEPDASSVAITLPESYVREELNSDPDQLFLFRAPGDGMDPTLRYRDFLLVNRSRRTPVSGRIFLIRLKQSLFCKRIQELPDGRLQLLSDNPNYPPIEIRPKDESPELIGMVVWVGRSV